MSKLLDLLREAHQRAARDNPNLSSQTVAALAQTGLPFERCVVGAINTLGGKHGPTAAARRVLRMPQRQIRTALAAGKIIPGFGNSFHKGQIDPAFVDLDEELNTKHSECWYRLHMIAREVIDKKGVTPNAAGYTAVVAEIEGLPEGTELRLVIEARLPVWAEIWSENRPGKELWEG